MVERFNPRIADVIRQTRFKFRAEHQATLTRYVQTHNHRIPQRALDHQSPIQALQKWRQDKPELFKKRVIDQLGLDR
jgi:transposase InsO family protein